MTVELPEWLLKNQVEIIGALLGVSYVILSVRQSILTWPAGILTSAFYIFVFLKSGFYAYMGLQVYYVLISLYGWYFWMKGNRKDEKRQSSVGRLNFRSGMILLVFTSLIFVLIHFMLNKFTDSRIPVTDSILTAFSITATWLLARKILENWLLWIMVDAVSAIVFSVKGMWPTSVLYFIYTVLAVSGFLKWKKSMIRNG